jgi:hypothetical protein
MQMLMHPSFSPTRITRDRLNFSLLNSPITQSAAPLSGPEQTAHNVFESRPPRYLADRPPRATRSPPADAHVRKAPLADVEASTAAAAAAAAHETAPIDLCSAVQRTVPKKPHHVSLCRWLVRLHPSHLQLKLMTLLAFCSSPASPLSTSRGIIKTSSSSHTTTSPSLSPRSCVERYSTAKARTST